MHGRTAVWAFSYNWTARRYLMAVLWWFQQFLHRNIFTFDKCMSSLSQVGNLARFLAIAMIIEQYFLNLPFSLTL